MRAFIFAFLFLTQGVSAEEACRPPMAGAMERAMARCQSTWVTPCAQAIRLTALVVAGGKARSVEEIYAAVGEAYQPTSKHPKSDVLEGMTLLLSELGLLEKP